MATRSYNASVEQEGSGPVALYPGLDVGSQCKTIESVTTNLNETIKLFVYRTDSRKVERQIHPLQDDQWVSSLSFLPKTPA